MTERIRIAESRFHKLKGDFPDVPTYPHVDTALLYQGDTDPFHIVLPIAEIGRISKNGLEYDTALVSAIAEQLQSGVGGIRGHIPDESLSTAYPLDAVLWIGHSQQGDTLYAKGYIPPGENREDIRRKKAVGGTVGTSIFGNAIKETSQTKKRSSWRAKEFKLEQVDLAPSQRAALENQRGFLITRETVQEGEDMPDVREITSAAEVPQAIREQIIAESEAGKKLARVTEMETQVAELQSQVSELAQYKQIVMEIRTTLKKDTDTAAAVAEQHAVASKLAEMLGVEYSNITITVQEMHETVKEFTRQKFEGAVDSKVAELTSKLDAVKTDAGKAKVTSFRRLLRGAVVTELGGEKSAEKIAEIGDKVWGDGFELISQSIVAELVGPAAIVGGRDNPKPEGTPSGRMTDEEREAVNKKFVPA